MSKYISLLNKIHIHPLLWLVFGIAIVTAHFKQLFILFFIVFIHEFGHAIAALFFSWRIKRILLLPFGGVAEVEEHGNRPFKEEFIVTLAGPVQHIWLVVAAFILMKLEIMSNELFSMFFEYNLAIFLINLLPIWPLDGGKLLFLLFTHYWSFSQAHEKLLLFSFCGVFILTTVIVWLNPFQISLWMIVLFLLYSLFHEWRHRQYMIMRFLLERYYGKKMIYNQLKPIVVEHTDCIFEILLQFYRGQKHSIVVMKNEKQQAVLDENELLHAFFSEKRVDEHVGNLLYY
ncbi:stage IV sporulation protein FB [Anoxybacillus calidus]|uniref:Stage IV sporulation protein FB n=1 Tax=[Anoxybacillus] calidus TaxID=575178 RepID=A0A7V9Z0B3_9BACL|nr:M50 family metallopeptidase [Anoxybacillus calidus]MBA2871605.1 stage IV sporulation protein FB [Anoxybacillus calidus]